VDILVAIVGKGTSGEGWKDNGEVALVSVHRDMEDIGDVDVMFHVF
jgi:hypothetical protein